MHLSQLHYLLCADHDQDHQQADKQRDQNRKKARRQHCPWPTPASFIFFASLRLPVGAGLPPPLTLHNGVLFVNRDPPT